MNEWASAHEAIAYIESRQRFGVKPGLDRTRRLLASLGSPERSLRFAHIAGTNGKGSTCALLASVLQTAGYRTGLYTSPYLSGFGERMSINRQEIDDASLIRYTAQIKAVIDGDATLQADPPTEFEVTTALALLYFQAEQADIIIWETGLGGRYDATNVVLPEVTAITNVALDHTQILGRRVEYIAADKAGICKPGRALVTAAQGAALNIIQSAAHKAEAPLYACGSDFRVTVEQSLGIMGQRLTYFGRRRDVSGLEIALLGPHQAYNSAVALCVLEVLGERGFVIAESALRTGLRTATWAGRLEVVCHAPLIVLDGAHNPHGAQALARALQVLAINRYVLVAGVLADKDIAGVVGPLAARALAVCATQARVPRAADASQVAAIAERFTQPGVQVHVAPAIADCLAQALTFAAELGPDVGIVVMGTLFTVAEARAHLLA